MTTGADLLVATAVRNGIDVARETAENTDAPVPADDV